MLESLQISMCGDLKISVSKCKGMMSKIGHKIGCLKNVLKWMSCQPAHWDKERERALPLSVVSSEVCQ